jgi:hypothetical protein
MKSLFDLYFDKIDENIFVNNENIKPISIIADLKDNLIVINFEKDSILVEDNTSPLIFKRVYIEPNEMSFVACDLNTNTIFAVIVNMDGIEKFVSKEFDFRQSVKLKFIDKHNLTNIMTVQQLMFTYQTRGLN